MSLRVDQELDDPVGTAFVQRAGRLVREDHRRLLDQRARDRDALALAAGELIGELVGVAGQAEVGQQPSRALMGRRSR